MRHGWDRQKAVDRFCSPVAGIKDAWPPLRAAASTFAVGKWFKEPHNVYEDIICIRLHSVRRFKQLSPVPCEAI